MRPYFKRKFWVQLGDGKDTNIWFDCWADQSPLSDFISKRAIRDANMSLNDSVDKVYVDSALTWPNELVDQFPSLSSISIPFRTDGEDKLCWREGSKLIPYSSSNAWEHIRHKVENVEWAECVWFPQCIPKHAFNMWLICQGEE
ncbi:hypothetical protein QVD17_07165 [Tagetes erecta]|uniref:Reverse transcriptase zinc-binding domain-containing protein n=1 Tax=Tagetes erecta TaxID=13708 RepID=A0AAD8PBW8_TARER|nr:hypothetical protein QVD17_07165 [Tagetes erecta]